RVPVPINHSATQLRRDRSFVVLVDMYADARDSFLGGTIHFPPSSVRTPSLFAQQCNESVTLFYLLPTSSFPFRIVRLLNRHVRELKRHTAVFRLSNQQVAIASIFFRKAAEYARCHRASS